jgi:hypothetical protein
MEVLKLFYCIEQKAGGGGLGALAAGGGGNRSGGSSSALNDLVDLNFGNPAPPLRTTASLDPWGAPPPPAPGLDPWGAPPTAQPVLPGTVT